MRTPPKRYFGLAAVLAALLAAGALAPLAWQQRHERVTNVPATPGATAGTGRPGSGPDDLEAGTVPHPTGAQVAAGPGAEEVPAEESETDSSNNAVSPSGPTLSFGRAAGLHLTPDPLRLNSSAVLVVDRGTGEVLVRKNDQAVLPMASLTKLMSTLLVVEAKQPLDEVLTITDDDVDRQRHSRSRLRVGTQLTRGEALRLALMSSENRATHALGRAYPGGLPRMVQSMNARARQLGMANTTYVDPTGLSNGNRSTARDLALLVGAASKVPLLREFSVAENHVATLGDRTLQYRNSNHLVRNDAAGWDIDLQKTGYIVEAGRCLTMLTKVGGHDLVMVMLDADSNRARLADAQKLRRWVVTQNGWPDDLAVAKPRSEPRQRVAAAKKKPDASAKRKTAVAKAEPKAGAKKRNARTAVAKKVPSRKDGRVRETFATGREEPKS